MSLTYLICRTHGYASKLLRRDLIRELATCRSLRELAERLSDTEYGPKLKAAGTALDFEKALAEVFVNRLSALSGLAPSRIKDFIESYLKKYEIQNLVWIARMKLGGASEGEVKRLLIPIKGVSRLDVESLIKAKNLSELINAIRESRTYQLPEEVENIIDFEAELWRSYYTQILKSFHASPYPIGGMLRGCSA